MSGNKRQLRRALPAVLSECIERMARGAGVQECLAAFPEHADALRPLLETVAALRATYEVTLSAEQRAAGRQRLLQQVQTPARRRTAFRVLSGSMSWRAWAGAASLGLVMFLGAGFGVVQAAGGSLPGDTLYPVKRTVENARLSVPFQSDETRAEYNARLAATRTQELAVMVRRRDVSYMQKLPADIRGNLDKSADLSPPGPEARPDGSDQPAGPANPDKPAWPAKSAGSNGPAAEGRRLERPVPEAFKTQLVAMRERLDRDYQSGLARLQAELGRAPEEFKPRIQHAIERFTAHYQDTIRKMDARIRAIEAGQTPEAGQPIVPGGPRNRPQSRPAAEPR